MHTPARRPRRGAGMTEYIIIVILVGIALIVAVTLFGWRDQEQYAKSAAELMELEEQIP
jgi:Flp pilus assembly pilin Flp